MGKAHTKTGEGSTKAVTVAYLGPEGTYSHIVAEKRYGHCARLVPIPSVPEVCAFVAERPQDRRGIVPIENSSGGAIYETVDILLENTPPVCILEEIALNVRLALLGRKGEKVKVLYSHFAPLEHCASWIRKRLPHVATHVVSSTAVAAQRAAVERYSAALANRRQAKITGLDVIKYPVQADIPNITVFLALGGMRRVQPDATKTSLALKLPNKPGALCTFLEAFRDQNVNLSRLISRPLRGCPREYAFLVDVEGAPGDGPVKRAMAIARPDCAELRVAGSYPTQRQYTS
jgi:prephenate dehydratase